MKLRSAIKVLLKSVIADVSYRGSTLDRMNKRIDPLSFIAGSRKTVRFLRKMEKWMRRFQSSRDLPPGKWE